MSKYLRGSELSEPTAVVIDVVRREQLHGTIKTVLYFRKRQQALVLNAGNLAAVVRIVGSGDISQWRGRALELVPDTIGVGGTIVDTIHVRAPCQAELAL